MIAKRLLDLAFSALVLILLAPLLAGAMVLVWAADGHSPLFRGLRVGRNNRDFRMAKLRSMELDTELAGAASTASSDSRITMIGAAMRRYKLDELPQFWNVLCGDMSIVGPRPNTRRGGVDRYTIQEMRLLTVRPGVTDIASIVFSDEADILADSRDPDRLYDDVIRPWKSRLGLLYIEHRNLWADLAIIALTGLALVSKRTALKGVEAILAGWGADEDLRRISSRCAPLPRGLPPGLAA
jgi:lipopolysaccharide/colanic/teichoic acid biosynthesis glycosyltransferase